MRVCVCVSLSLSLCVCVCVVCVHVVSERSQEACARPSTRHARMDV